MRRNSVRNEDRARIVLSRERDIERKLDEKERITLQLEEYMKQYAALTGVEKVLSHEIKMKKRSRRGTLVFLLLGLALIAGIAAYKLIVG